MIRFKIQHAVLFSILSLFIISFQNCAEEGALSLKSIGNNNNQAENNPTDETVEPVEEEVEEPVATPTPAPPKFRAGDVVSVDKMPSDKTYMKDGLNAYIVSGGFKAIAIAANGYGYMSYGGQTAVSNDQAEANQRALEACQIASNNNACAIWAEANVVKYDEADFPNNFVLPINLADTSYAPAKVPWIDSDVRGNQLNAYTNGATQKALALALDGGGGFGRGEASQNAARNTALTECRNANAPDDCIIYAVNGQIVLDAAIIEAFFMANYYEAPPSF